MSEKRFIVENDNNEVSIKDKVKDNYPFALAYEHIDDADNLIQECLSLVGMLNEQQAEIERLKEQLSLVCNAESSAPYNSVKEVLRRQIFGIDHAAEESPNAWHHYLLLSKLFEEQYGEYWDNED